MPEKPKPDTKKQDRPADDEDSEKEVESSYYYDDAHGYEDFDPDKDEEFED